jgi:formylglycine-generating enzyme required for sulfatase activity
LHGNVQEWCEDEWHLTYAGAPADGSAWVTPGDEDPFRLLRGGSCWHFATACTCAARQMLRADAHDEPDELPDDDLLGRLLRDRPPVGFRVVVEAGRTSWCAGPTWA